MSVKYLDPKTLSAKQKAELRRVLNFKLKEIQGKLNELDRPAKKSKKAKKSKR